MAKVIESSTAIRHLIPSIFRSHHQTKVAFVNAHPCQPQSNASFTCTSNKVYLRKIPDGKYVNRKWVTYNKTNKKSIALWPSFVQILLHLVKELK
jgi:hypothetical protein